MANTRWLYYKYITNTWRIFYNTWRKHDAFIRYMTNILEYYDEHMINTLQIHKEYMIKTLRIH